MALADGKTTLHGVGSLVDSEATRRVKAIWSRLDRELGLRGVLVMPYPHVSYQVAQGYDRDNLEVSLARLARETRPFTIRTMGLATFPGPWPVVFVAVEKDYELRAFHGKVWEACLPHARDAFAYYHPDSWIPHITLAHGEERNSVPLSGDQVNRVLATLNDQDCRWEIAIDNITLVWDYGTSQKPARTFPLQGQ